jgi:hypothetical protein
VTQVVVSIASQARREVLLGRTLESLRLQCDVLCVYLNGYAEVPGFARELAQHVVHDRANNGAERKFWWAQRFPDALCFTCDDDIAYPPDYVAVMRAALEEHPGAAVTAHGRSFRGIPLSVHHVVPGSVGKFHRQVNVGSYVNHAGTGVLAWDARRLTVPDRWPLQNIADAQFAVWAQQARVPIWLVPHEAGWLSSPALRDPLGLFAASRQEGHARRSALLREQGHRQDWEIFG